MVVVEIEGNVGGIEVGWEAALLIPSVLDICVYMTSSATLLGDSQRIRPSNAVLDPPRWVSEDAKHIQA